MRTLLLLGVLVVSLPALAKPVRKPIAYDADLKLEGVLVYDDAVKAPRPGLLMVPNWLGINEANLRQAELVAAKDYVIFVATNSACLKLASLMPSQFGTISRPGRGAFTASSYTSTPSSVRSAS
jgi:hypothetical protein